jgi:uncharacterized protein
VTSRMVRALSLVAAVLMLAPGLSGSAGAKKAMRGAGPPTDYTEIKGLSQDKYETVREDFMVPMKDGVSVYVEVVRPDAPGRFGTILEMSPYHGTIADRSGTRIFPGPVDADGTKIGLAGYFAPKGYAVVFVDLRGTGRSEGCLDHMGPKDQSDSKEIVEWAAKQKWSNGRVGMTGHSYVGSTPSMAAAQKPKHLVTIVPSAGLARMYDHEFQEGVPYFLQWAGPLYAYEELAIARHLPPTPIGDPSGNVPPLGDNFGNGMEYFGCGMTQSAAVTGDAYFSGAETPWHVERDWTKKATKAKIPVFMIHGVNDNAARIAGIDWYNRREQAGDKTWIGQWDHGSGCCPNRREDQWTYALHAWFDKHLLQRDVDTGPPTEIFLNTTEVYTDTQWPPKPSRIVKLFPQADTSLSDRPGEDASVNYVGDPRGFETEFDTGSVSFTTTEVKEDTFIVGVPKLRLTATVAAARTHLIATMYDVDENGEASGMAKATFAINPELRNGIDDPQPVLPTEKMVMKLTGMAQAYVLAKGHSLRLIIASSHPDKVPVFAEGLVTVHLGGNDGTMLTFPVVDNAKFYPDPLLLNRLTQ